MGTPSISGRCGVSARPTVTGAREAVCRLFFHQLGWEQRGEVGSELRRSQVCRTEPEAFETYETWKAAMIGNGWRWVARSHQPSARVRFQARLRAPAFHAGGYVSLGWHETGPIAPDSPDDEIDRLFAEAFPHETEDTRTFGLRR